MYAEEQSCRGTELQRSKVAEVRLLLSVKQLLLLPEKKVNHPF
jgi:hypothetical protein